MLSIISILIVGSIACTVLVVSALMLSSRMSHNEFDVEAMEKDDEGFDGQYKPNDVV